MEARRISRRRRVAPAAVPAALGLPAGSLAAGFSAARFLFLALFATAFIGAGFLGTAPGLSAQERLIERTGTAQVPIHEDNLDAAKGRAVAGAQHNALLEALGGIVAQEWLNLFQAELKRSILARPEKYIASYRVHRLQASLDRTRYQASISAQIDRARLVRDVRRVPLPVKGDPLKSLLVLYPADDPIMGNPAARQAIAQHLRRRMALLNFQVRGVRSLSQREARIFGGASSDAGAKGAWLSKRNAAAGLFLSFALGGSAKEGAEEGAWVTAQLIQGGNGASLGIFSVKSGREVSPPMVSGGQLKPHIRSALLDPLIAQLQPGGIKVYGATSGSAAPMQLRILGLGSVAEEEAFAQQFFLPESAFANFFISRLDRHTVTYQGSYRGDRRALEIDLPGSTYGNFRISNVFWFNGVLELEVEQSGQPLLTEAKLFPEALRPPALVELVRAFLEKNPELLLVEPTYTEVEDNSWLTRANRIPFNTTIYGFVDSRSDTDYFVGEELKEGEQLIISWYRVGRTNLNPAVRLYDGQGKPIRFYTPNNWIRARYRVPKGQHRVFIEVGDRFAGIRTDSGGYLNFHYLLQVDRTETD